MSNLGQSILQSAARHSKRLPLPPRIIPKLVLPGLSRKGTEVATPVTNKWPQRSVLDDSYELAEKVLGLLKKEQREEALQVLRRHHQIGCTVGWNYLIRYDLSKRKVNAAFSHYNEVCRLLFLFCLTVQYR